MSKLIDLTKFPPFGRWKVLRRGPDGSRRQRQWWCECTCGTIRLVDGWSLRKGDTTSCGCLKDEKTAQRFRTHGMTDTPEYSVWCGMKRRCLNPNEERYKNYGGRGIHIVERWLDSFENFYADMGPRPSKRHSIERIDNDKPYGPDNTRWATPTEQARNTTRNRFITLDGETACLQEWLNRKGLSQRGFYRRIQTGLSEESALTIPVDIRRRRKQHV